MGKFIKDCKGAVTVFVTLLLIPAILISGTAVDLVRVYTAKSIIHDANQLAANSTLASYDALLQDLYGIFGYVNDDPELAGMLNTYIETAIFGDNPNKGLGTFQLFYGANLQSGEITPLANQNLANQEVLRRQIEEYVKFRAPVIIAERVIETLKKFDKLSADSKIIDDKLEIDQGMEDLQNNYQDLYNKIIEVNNYQTILNDNIFININNAQKNINNQFKEILNLRNEYTNAYDSAFFDDDLENDYIKHYNGLIENIKTLVSGGNLNQNWIAGTYDDEGNWIEGYFESTYYTDGLETYISQAKKNVENAKKALKELKDLCDKAQSKKSELSNKVKQLENDIKTKDCSQELKDGLTKPIVDSNNKTMEPILDTYKTFLVYDIDKMGQAVQDTNNKYLDNILNMLNDFKYGKDDVNNSISLSNLKNLKNNAGFAIDLKITSQNSTDELKKTVNNGYTPLKIPTNYKFYKFQDEKFNSTKNAEFYNQLENLFKNSSSSNNDSQKDSLINMLGEIKNFFAEGFGVDPAGARYYKNNNSTSDLGSGFGIDDDWSSTDGILNSTKDALNENLIAGLSDTLLSAGNDITNKLLLVTYATEMFSNYATPNSDKKESMTGIPFSININYFYQSEQEYIYNGNEGSATANLLSVIGVILLIRFVSNYIASFSIPSVNTFVSGIKSVPPFGFIVGELARLVIVLGESALDVARLRNGQNVAIFKDSTNWKLSLEGLTGSIMSSLKSMEEAGDDSGITLNYSDYMRILLLFTDGDEVAKRISRLISLNVTNKKNGFGMDSRETMEQAMSTAKLFDMSKAITDFSITTTVDMRMLFLSMPFAQKGINGVVPAGTLQISATDYRGY